MNNRLLQEQTVARGLGSGPSASRSAVLEVKIVQKQNMYGYHEDGKKDFLRVTLAQPRFIAAAKRTVEHGFAWMPGTTPTSFTSFETNVDFEIRFMIDAKVRKFHCENFRILRALIPNLTSFAFRSGARFQLTTVRTCGTGENDLVEFVFRVTVLSVIVCLT